MKQQVVVIVGLGCIGGSLARRLSPLGVRVRAWSTSNADNAMARDAGIEVPEASLEETVRGADFVILAVPLPAIADVAARVIAECDAEAVIAHCCGLQSQGALRLSDAVFARIIGAHPIAGSHDSGFAASRADLFDGCTVSAEARATDEQRTWIEWLCQHLGVARTDYRDGLEHDTLMAWISHLPQVTATALAATIALHDIEPLHAGPGLRDSTRLAASGFDQWSSLLRAQPKEVSAALEAIERTVAALRKAIAKDDTQALAAIWNTARAWRRNAELPS